MSRAALDWSEVMEWFGCIPHFHDDEVISIDLRRDPEPSVISIRAFMMTPEVDSHGYYVLDKHATVKFTLNSILEQELDGWNHQNAIMNLEITDVDTAWRLEINPAYGVGGYFVAESITMKIEPVIEANRS